MEEPGLPAAVIEQVRVLTERKAPIPAERLSGVHNPWGSAAALVDAWAFLSLCEAEPLVDRVADLIGEDVILWDSELVLQGSKYARFVEDGREGRYWPVDPLAGAVALCPDLGGAPARVIPVPGIAAADLHGFDPAAPLLVIRYMAGASRFRRDAEFPPNRIAMEEQVLINFPRRPLWMVRGEDRAGNDFVTGFAPAPARWAGAAARKD